MTPFKSTQIHVIMIVIVANDFQLVEGELIERRDAFI